MTHRHAGPSVRARSKYQHWGVSLQSRTQLARMGKVKEKDAPQKNTIIVSTITTALSGGE